MNISKQIKKHRELKQISQEELAGKIHVSRQTISNRETGRSYPDIHNLLLLSVFFDISLDELVKGDVESMKKSIKASEMSKLSQVMGAFSILTAISVGPALKFIGVYGMAIPLFFWVVAMVAAFKIEKIKKEKGVKTYQEIVAFMENKDIEVQKKKRNKTTDFGHKFFIVVIFGLVASVLAGISCLVFLL